MTQHPPYQLTVESGESSWNQVQVLELMRGVTMVVVSDLLLVEQLKWAGLERVWLDWMVGVAVVCSAAGCV